MQALIFSYANGNLLVTCKLFDFKPIVINLLLNNSQSGKKNQLQYKFNIAGNETY